MDLNKKKIIRDKITQRKHNLDDFYSKTSEIEKEIKHLLERKKRLSKSIADEIDALDDLEIDLRKLKKTNE